MLVKNEHTVLTKHDNIAGARILIVMKLNLSGLLTDVGNPCLFHFSLCLALCLSISLRIQVIVCKSLHRLTAVALDLKVRVGDDNRVCILRISHWSWDQVICQLNLEHNIAIVNKVKRSIHRLNADLLFHILILKVAVNKVVSLSLQLLAADVFDLRERFCRLDGVDAKLGTRKNSQAEPIMFVTKFTRANLEDWLSDIFFNYKILNMILIVHEGIWLENS